MTKKIIIFTTLITLIFSVFAGFCYADEELEPAQENITNESSKSTTTSSAPMTIDDPSYQSTSTRVSTVNYSNLPEANLGLNNILCIILISIGVLLILFAIAILIRLN